MVRFVHASRLDMKVSAYAESKLSMIFRLTSQLISTYLCPIWRVETLTFGRMKPRARATPPVWENLLLQNRCSSSHLQYASCHKRSSRLALIKFCFYLAVPIVPPKKRDYERNQGGRVPLVGFAGLKFKFSWTSVWAKWSL